MGIILPVEVIILMDILKSYNHDSYVVGGCVRDSLLGREPNDWDICTEAKPEKVLQIFESLDFKVIPTGLKHGTVTVVFRGQHFEITTFRLDGDYSDGRRPDDVQFTSSLIEDLARRDFTINAMAYNPYVGLVDPYGGVTDLEAKRIRAVGFTDDRFEEDALRMLRAVRFQAQLDFKIQDNTFLSIIQNKMLISNISNERIRDELCKILMSDNAELGFVSLVFSGLLQMIMPELTACFGFGQQNPNHDKCVFFHTMSVVKNTPKKLKTRLAALFHDIAKPVTFTLDDSGIGHFYSHHMVGMDMARDIMTKLKFDNKMIDDVCILVKEHMSRHKEVGNTVAKKFINRVGIDNLDDLFDLMRADTLGSVEPHDFSDVDKLQELCELVINEKQPMTVKDLAINGQDLIEIGMKPSKRMGEIINDLLELVLVNPEWNNQKTLIDIAKGKEW